MALDNPFAAALSPRATQILGGADALLPDSTSSLFHTVSAVPAADLLGLPGDNASAGDASSAPLSGVTDLANAAVLDLHGALETTADQNGLVGAIHGVTNLGETVGLGRIGDMNLVTELVTAPTALASGDTSGLGQTVPNVAAVGSAVSGLANGVVSDAGVNSSLVHPLGTVATHALAETTSALTNLGATLGGAASGSTGIDGVLNQTVAALAPVVGLAGEAIVHDTTVGLLDVTNAVGLGDIGGHNLLTDLGHLPSAILAGDATPLQNIPGDLAAIGNAVAGTVEGLGHDITTSTILGTLTGLTTGAGVLGGALPAQGVTGAIVAQLDNVVNGVGALNGIQPITHAVTDVTDGLVGGSGTLGAILGDLGGNADGLSALPGQLGGAVGSLSNIVAVTSGELGHSGILADVINPVSSLIEGNGAGGLLGSLSGGRAGTALGGVASTLEGGLNQAADGLAPTLAAVGGAIVHDTTGGLLGTLNAAGLGDLGGHNLLSDVVQAPTALLAGNATPLTNLPGDLATVASGLATTVDGLGNDTTTSTILGAVTHLTDGGQPGSGVPGLSAVLNDVGPQLGGLVNTVGALNGIEPITSPAVTTVESVLHLPDAITSGGLASLPADLGSTIGTAGDVVGSIAGQLPNSAVLGAVIDPVAGLFGDHGAGLGILPTAGTSGPIHDVTAPLDALLNQAADGLAPTIATVGGAIVHGTTTGVLDTASNAGLGDLGGHNLLTDVAQAPAGTLGGDTTSLTNLPGDLASVASGLAATVSGLGHDTTTSTILGAVTHLTDGGQGGSAVPGLNGVLGEAAPQIDGVVNTVGMLSGIQPITSAATDATDAILHSPDAVTGGGLQSVPADVGSAIHDVGGVVSAIAGQTPNSAILADVITPVASLVEGGTSGGLGSLPVGGIAGGDALGTVTGLLGGTTGGGTDGALHAVTGVLGGLTGAGGDGLLHTVTGLLDGASGGGAGGALGGVTGLLGGATGTGSLSNVAGLVGDLSGTSASGHAAATVAVGPQTSSGGIAADVLSNAGGQTQIVATHSGTAAAPAPTVAGVGLLSDTSFHFPVSTGGGSDALSGVLHSVTAAATPAAGAGDAHAIDLGVAHIDLPVATAHADPLASLAHAIPHV